MEEVTVTTIVAMVFSVVLDFFPGVNTYWNETFSTAQKRIINAMVVMAVSIGAHVVNCTYYGNCPAEGDWLPVVSGILFSFLVAAGSQQAVREKITKPFSPLTRSA